MGFDPDDGTNFLAIHAKAADGASIVAQAVPTQGTPSASFTDDDCVFQITPETTGVKFTVSKGAESIDYVYTLNVELEDE